jgi:hypothetical protein
MHIDQLFDQYGDQAYWLEDRGDLERIAHPSPDDIDGGSTWFCRHCGMEVEDIFDGCSSGSSDSCSG